MTDPKTQAAVERLTKSRDRARETAKRGDIFNQNPQLAAMAIEAGNYAEAIDTVLADHARQAERIKELEGAHEAALWVKIVHEDDGLKHERELAVEALCEALSATPPAPGGGHKDADYPRAFTREDRGRPG